MAQGDCRHQLGAGVSDYDEDEVAGSTEAEGFTEQLDRIELEPVREALGAALEARIPQA